ncbi:hypothetical protein M8C21_019401 [Ambrosia artemisiifolia]|uniref:Uncharacterized protein n=1 Tax=Ambrosia artemisiifolia TaxID=4212 RepID=A0AAD5C5V2_AMBAR|nr:hypothetical protein M8C21_019401 [Ambrosia artemisiifolia]
MSSIAQNPSTYPCLNLIFSNVAFMSIMLLTREHVESKNQLQFNTEKIKQGWSKATFHNP